MNQVKELCDLALESPAPPLPGPEAVIRAARRQNRYVATASAAALMAVVAVVFAFAGSGRAPVTTVPQEAASVALPAVPGVDAAHNHSLQIARLLVAAVPPGSAASAVRVGDDGVPASTWRLENGGDYVSTTRVVVTLRTGEGNLSATIEAYGKEPLSADLCSAQAGALLSRLAGAPEANCNVVTVNGTQVRVSSANAIAAVRPLQGGFLAVLADKAIGMTTDQVAALAADPGMLP